MPLLLVSFRFRQRCVFQPGEQNRLAFPFGCRHHAKKLTERSYDEREHSSTMVEKEKLREAYGFK